MLGTPVRDVIVAAVPLTRMVLVHQVLAPRENARRSVWRWPRQRPTRFDQPPTLMTDSQFTEC